MGNFQSIQLCRCYKKDTHDHLELNTENKIIDDGNLNSAYTREDVNVNVSLSNEFTETIKSKSSNRNFDSPEKIEVSKSALPRSKDVVDPFTDENNNENKEIKELTPPKHPSKKQLMYINMATYHPLEVINELNTESCNESLKLSEGKKRKFDKKNLTDSNPSDEIKFVLIAEMEKKDKEKTDIDYDEEVAANKSHNNTERQNKRIVGIDNNGTAYSNKKLVEVLREDNQNPNSNQNNTGNKLNNNNNNNIDDGWKKLLITNIIPEHKLLQNSSGEEVLFQGVLVKFAPSLNKNQKPTYATKFCIMTRREFKCYKSREAFLTFQNNFLKIPIESIAFAKRMLLPLSDSTSTSTSVKKKIDKKVYIHFYIQMVDTTNEDSLFNNQTNNWSSEDDKSFDSQRRNRGVKITTQGITSRKTNLKEATINSVCKGADNSDFKISNMCIFASEKEKDINNWLCVINYFSKKVY